MDSSTARMALKSAFLTIENSEKAECDRFLKKLNCCKIKIPLLNKLILEKTAAMKAMSTHFLDMEKMVASVESEK